jgi:4-amino-4-deoxychorismate lyase
MILVNGQAENSIPASDRGLAYGDGVFRTMVMRRGCPQHWLQHFAKLSRDCSALGIRCPDAELLAGDVAAVGKHDPDCVLKIIITRGQGQRGYAPPASVHPLRVVMTAPLPDYPEHHATTGIKARICSMRLGWQPLLAGVKHLNRLENVLARMEWSDPEIAEGILLDAGGNVICGTMSNLFIVERGALITPDLARCGVAGVTRERLIQSAAAHGLNCLVDAIDQERLMRSDEVLLVNSIIGVWQIASLGDRNWMPGMLVQHARKWLADETA